MAVLNVFFVVFFVCVFLIIIKLNFVKEVTAFCFLLR